MQPLRLCLILAFIVALRAYELSGELAEFYCAVNGNYTDKQQVEKDGSSRSLINVKIVPVVVPALSQLPVLYLEQSQDGNLSRALILIVSQEKDGIIYTEPKNITGNTDIKPGQFNVNRIKSFTKQDLRGQQDCRDAFERIEEFEFAINYPDCKTAPVNKQRESFSITDTCTDFYTFIPASSADQWTLVPYQFKLEGNKYPLEDAPANYVCNCDKPST